MKPIMQRERLCHRFVFILFLGLMSLLTGCGGGSASSNNSGPPPPPAVQTAPALNTNGSLQFVGFASQQSTVMSTLVSQLPIADLAGISSVQAAAPTQTQAAGSVTYGAGVITIYQGATPFDNSTLLNALLNGIGQSVYTNVLSASDQAKVQQDAANANAFFPTINVPQVTAAELFGNSYQAYVSNTSNTLSLAHEEIVTASYPDPETNRLVPISGNNSWVLAEPMMVGGQFFVGTSLNYVWECSLNTSTGQLTLNSAALLIPGGAPWELQAGATYAAQTGQVIVELGTGGTVNKYAYAVALPANISQAYATAMPPG